VPIFQEQVMQIAMLAAGFTPGEADQPAPRDGRLEAQGRPAPFHERWSAAWSAAATTREFAERIFRQIEGFGEYGFPESHAASFALLVYVSGLAQVPRARDASWPRCSTASRWASTRPRSWCRTRAATACEVLMAARRERAFADVDDLARRARLDARDLQALAQADALATLAGHRRRQLWAAAGQGRPERALLADAPVVEAAHEQPDLFEAPEGEAIALDYRATGLTLRRHPMALLRERAARRGWKSAQQLDAAADGSPAWACGIVTMRQQPETAKGTIFVTLEDETGSVNVIVWRHVRERQRPALMRSRLLAVAGTWQRQDGVTHLVARRLVDMTPWLGAVATASRDFH
jgi:error-prone DNA polymerase